MTAFIVKGCAGVAIHDLLGLAEHDDAPLMRNQEKKISIIIN